MKKPTISVVMISYNHEKYIRQAIESILSQTYLPDEIILVDDCSDDKTLSIMREYEQADKRISIIAHERNLGTSSALNSGIQRAQGEYIVMQSGDDISLPKRIEKQIEYLRKHDAIASVCSHVAAIDDSGNYNPRFQSVHDVFNIPQISRNKMLYDFFVKGNMLNASSQTVRSSIFSTVGLYNPTLLQYQDYDMNIRISFASSIDIIEEPLLQYRIRDDGKNISVGRGLQSVRCVLETDTLLSHYLSIQDVNEFIAIFGADRYKKIRKETIPYFLGKVLLDEDAVLGKKMWALKTIYQTINEEDILELLHEDIGYEYKDFILLAEQL